VASASASANANSCAGDVPVHLIDLFTVLLNGSGGIESVVNGTRGGGEPGQRRAQRRRRAA
jgi:hypothetical protein